MAKTGPSAKPALAIFYRLHAHNLVPLLDEICQRRGVLVHEICGPARTLSVTRARHELWWTIRHHPERSYSFPELARLFRCDPSTILSGVRSHERRRAARRLAPLLAATTTLGTP